MNRIFGLFGLLFLLAYDVVALQVVPMESTLDIAQKKASETFTIHNDQDFDTAIDVKLFLRSFEGKDNDVRTLSSDFVVHPKAIKIKSGEQRNIILHWKGGEPPKSEKAYRLVISQLPIDFKKTKKSGPSGIKFLYQYVASIYVPSIKSRISLKIENIKLSPNNNALLFNVKNDGNVHQILNKGKISFYRDKKTVKSFEVNHIKELLEYNLLSGAHIEVSVPWSEKVPERGELTLE